MSIIVIIIINIDLNGRAWYTTFRARKRATCALKYHNFGEKTIRWAAWIIKNLNVSIENQPILTGVNLVIPQGEVHAIMGPNATGKSTLAYTVMGHPKYTITEGQILLDGKDIMDLSPEERSKAGIFLAFQYPVAIPGVTVANFIRTAMNAHRKSKNPAG